MNIHQVFKALVGVVLFASVGFLALLAYAAWTIEPERQTCGTVALSGLKTVTQDAPPAPWIEAVAAPGWMITAEEVAARYRYFEPGNPAVAAIHFDGKSHPVKPESFEALCARQDGLPQGECRFFEEGAAFGLIRFERGHILESETDYVASELRKVQADGSTVEVFVTSRDTHEIEAAECDLARALEALNEQTDGKDKQ